MQIGSQSTPEMADAAAPRSTAPGEDGAYRYRAYGLSIASAIALPELERDETSDAPDVEVRVDVVDWPEPAVAAGAVIDLSADTQYLAWANVGRFAIRGRGERIDVEPAPGVSEAVLRLPLLGPVMALLLYLRGHLVLHASAIAIGGAGVIFVGNKHAGKSTTAAALVSAGHRLLADDVVAIDFSEPDAAKIRAGFPQLKLDRTVSMPGVRERMVEQPPILPHFAKRHHRMIDRFAHEDVRPARVYILGRASTSSATPIARAEGLTALMQFSYVTRFGSGLLKGTEEAEHLRRCAALAGATPVVRLTVPDSVERLGEVVDLIESDLS